MKKRILSVLLVIVMLVCSMPMDENINDLFRIDASAAPIFEWPVSTSYGISTGYYGYTDHGGVDFAVPVGTPVYASEAGTITIKDYGCTGSHYPEGIRKGWGCKNSNCAALSLSSTGSFANHAIITHSSGYTSYYCHMTTGRWVVSDGATVAKGQLIGYSGVTGKVTGPHLHFEIRQNGSRVNPENLLNKVNSGGSGGGSSASHTRDTNYGTNFSATANARIDVVNANHSDPGNYYIDPGDICTIHEVYTDGCCLVTYPSSASPTGTRTYYAPINMFLFNTNQEDPIIELVYWGDNGTKTHLRPVVQIKNPETVDHVSFPVWSHNGDDVRHNEYLYDSVFNGGLCWFNDIPYNNFSCPVIESHCYVYGKNGSSQHVALPRTYNKNFTCNLDVNMQIDGVKYATGASGFTFDLCIDGKTVAEDISDWATTHYYGESFGIRDIKCPGGYVFSGGNTSGQLTSNTEVVLTFSQSMGTLDLNGLLDGGESGAIGNYGTADVYINGKLVSEGCWDYCESLPSGTTYEIKNIKAVTGKQYNGVYSGSLSGTIQAGQTANIKLNFSTLKYNLHFNANGGTGAPAMQQKTHGTDLIISSAKPTGKSYTVTFNGNGGSVSVNSKVYTQSFDGWNTKQDGSGTIYQPGGIYYNNSDQTLYAMWKNPDFNIADPTRSGYYFAGWYDSTETNAYGKPMGKQYTRGTDISKNITLYAMWVENIGTTLFFGDYNLDGELTSVDALAYSKIASNKLEYTDDDVFRGDMNANGYIDDEDSSIIIRVCNELINLYATNIYLTYKQIEIGQYPKTTYKYGEPFDPSGMKLYANLSNGIRHTMSNDYSVSGYDPYKIGKQIVTINYYFEKVELTVNVLAPEYFLYYDSNGGSVYPMAKTVIYGSSIGALPTPEKEGHTFLGWAYEVDSSSYITNSTVYSYMSNKTIYAQWKKCDYTVSFNANGGSISTGSKSVTYGNTYGALPTPTRNGYTFNGWYTAALSDSKVTSATIVSTTNNHTLYAQWTCNHDTTESGNEKTATCTAEGYSGDTYCKTCGVKINSGTTIEKLDHTYTFKITIVATCNSEGIKTFTCVDCDANYIETISKKVHTEVIVSDVAATCTAAGLTEGRYCSVCNEVIEKQEEIEALGHDWSDSHECSRCGLTDGEIVYDTSVTLSKVTGRTGETVEVYVAFDNDTDVKTMSISDIVYDSEKLTLVSGEWLAEDAVIENWNQNDETGVITFKENKALSGNVFALTFEINEECDNSEVAIDCDFRVTAMQDNGAENQLATEVIPGSVSIADVLKGDVNGDDFVNSNDAIHLLYHTMLPERYEINQNCDFNGDGYVNSNDAIYLLYHAMLPERYPLP